MNALLCIRLPSEEARKDFLDATFKHNAPFVLSIEPDDIVSFVKKDPKEDGSAKIAHPINSMDQTISTDEPIRLPFTPVGYPNTNEFGHVQAQVSSVANALEMSQASDFSFRQAQAGNTVIQNAFFSSSGPSVFDREQQEAPIFTTLTNPFRSEHVVQDTHSLPIHPADSNGPDDLVAEPVVKEEFEQSNAAKQANSSSIFSEGSPTTPMTRSFYRQVQAKDTVGNAAVESVFHQNDYEMDPIGLFAPDVVVKEEYEQPVNQVPPPLSPVAFDQEEPYDIFQDTKPQHIDLDQPRVVVAEIDMTKDSDIIKKEDLDDDLDEDKEEETREEVGDEEDSSDAGEYLDAKDKAYTPKDSGMLKKEDPDEELEEENEEEADDDEDFSDAGEHLDLKDKAYTLKGSSSKKKRHLCEVCQKVFNDTRGLRKHLRVHTGEKRHQCDVCQKCFRVKQKLTNHLRVHTGERPFSCEVCQKCFSSYTSHKRHLLIHTGEKPFECNDCKAKFTQLSSLKRHRFRRHS